jgi:hypothetical protein
MRELTPAIEVPEVIPTTEVPGEFMGAEIALVTAETAASLGSERGRWQR